MTTRAKLQSKLLSESKRKATEVRRYNKISRVKRPLRKSKPPMRFRGIIRPFNQGIADYSTLGIAGDYNVQFNTATNPAPRFTTPFSNYNIAYTGQPMEAFNNYTRQVNTNGVQMEPDMFNQTQSNVFPNTSASEQHAMDEFADSFIGPIYHTENDLRARSHLRGSVEDSSYMARQMELGFAGEDPNIHDMLEDEGLDADSVHSNIYAPITDTPQQGGGYAFITPSTGAHHNFQEHGSVNSVSDIDGIQTPRGRVDYSEMSDRTTPAARGPAGWSIAVHPSMQGPEGAGVPHDGGWTFDINQNQTPITLSDLPPAAEIPIQTWGPAILTARTPQFSRPAGQVRMSLHQHV